MILDMNREATKPAKVFYKDFLGVRLAPFFEGRVFAVTFAYLR
jgi:hypothetical protein